MAGRIDVHTHFLPDHYQEVIAFGSDWPFARQLFEVPTAEELLPRLASRAG